MTRRSRGLGEGARYALAAVVLFAGGLLYLARPTDPLAVTWLERSGLGSLAAAVRATRQLVHLLLPLPGWLRGTASDFAYAFAIGVVFGNGSPPMVALGFGLALAHEVAQGFGLASGTFDVIDLAVLAGAYLLALALFRPRAKRAPGASLSSLL